MAVRISEEPDSLDEQALQELAGRDERAGDVADTLLALFAEYEDQLPWADAQDTKRAA